MAVEKVNLTDTFSTWKDKINQIIDHGNSIVIGTAATNVPTVSTVDSKDTAIKTELSTSISNVNASLSDTINSVNTSLTTKIDNSVSTLETNINNVNTSLTNLINEKYNAVSSDNIALILALS